MKFIRHAVLVVASLALVAGCPAKKKDTLTLSTGSISITANKTSVVADNSNTVTLTVTNSTGSAATLTTTQGALNVSTVSGASGTATLTTCAFGASGCTAATTTVTATAGGKSATALVTFGTAATLCPTDCTADASCLNVSCTAVSGGTCKGTFPALTCTAAGGGGGGGGGGGTQVLGALSLPSPAVQNQVLGALGSGFQELGWLKVQAVDQVGSGIAGVNVHFEQQKLGGSTFATPVACAVASANCVAADAITDADGVATVWLHSGTVAGTLHVNATANAGGVARSVDLPPVAVVGAKASGTNFSIQCSPRNVPAFAETDCGVSWVDAPYTCVALAKDRYGNLLGTATPVIFKTEAGGVAPIAFTTAYDPTLDSVAQATLGSATEIFQTLGAGLPIDAPADTANGEPYTIHGLDGCGSRTHNPRDGLVTVIAAVDGEEAFFDANGNGVYDPGEPFIDQGEPFVDANDNGKWDPGEQFLDVDGNKAYTPGNGVWDANTKIWTQTVVVYTGSAATVPAPAPAGYLLGTRWSDAPAANCTPTSPTAHFNVTAARTTPTAIPATSQDVYAYGSDLNLNLLATKASYAVTVETGTITAKYQGLPSYADDLGVFYRYWPCDQANPANCASQCERTGTTTYCVMMPSIRGYGCGVGAAVTITGGTVPDPGVDLVKYAVDTPVDLFKTSRVDLGAAWITGTSN